MTRTSRDDIEAVLLRSGLILSSAQIDQIHAGWALVRPMLDVIRDPGRDRACEPAPMFLAETSTFSGNEAKTP
jgi:hypothetical protein